jgi:hypothetical protein
MTKDEMVALATDRAKALMPANTPIGRGCVWLSHCMADVLKEQGIRATVLAGSASFLAVPDHLDDGVIPTHYSYQYDPHSVWTMDGPIPEVHCWTMAMWQGHAVLIDLTTPYVPDLCEGIGVKWRTPRPLSYLWAYRHQIPKGWVYESDERASKLIGLIYRSSYVPVDTHTKEKSGS